MSEIISSTYELIERIGSGGGGVVYLANHLRLGKKVVLKADKRKLTTRPELLRREVDVLKNMIKTEKLNMRQSMLKHTTMLRTNLILFF